MFSSGSIARRAALELELATRTTGGLIHLTPRNAQYSENNSGTG